MNLNSLSKTQVIVILSGIALVVLLLLIPQKPAEDATKAEPVESKQSGNTAILMYSDSVEKGLDKGQFANLQALKSAKNIDSIIGFWKANKQPAIAAIYLQQKAKDGRDARSYAKAGDLYYMGAKFTNDQYRSAFVTEAMASYQYALRIDSTNLDAKVSLGTLYVEATELPMEGIKMLRSVLVADSNHLGAHMSLGIFAVQSGQYDKAIDRFKKVLSIKPDNIETYLYLGQAYASSGDKKKAIEVLEKYKKLSNDATINEEVSKYIKELKNS